ncbi:MAG: hypothetical protein U1E45_14350 [Geminicoccaceae bacterium]
MTVPVQARSPVVSAGRLIAQARGSGPQGEADALAEVADLNLGNAIEARIGALFVALTDAAASEIAAGRRQQVDRFRHDHLKMADRLTCRAIQAAEALARLRGGAKGGAVVVQVRRFTADDGEG